MKKALVCGGGGFIGGHIVKRLLAEGYCVVAVDIRRKVDWDQTHSEANNLGSHDLRIPFIVENLIAVHKPDELYQLAADMGGAGYIFTGEHDADVMHNSATINLNVAHSIAHIAPKCKVFYSSSACIYPQHNQEDPENPNCEESSAYPANPDSEYGWEKLFSERLWRSYARNYGLSVRIARFHNIFGPEGTWEGGREKAPAAMCRKVLEAQAPEEMSGTMMDEARIPHRVPTMEVWGDGQQTRSFMYIDECVEAVRRLMESEVEEVINIGSDEMIKINDLAKMAVEFSGKDTFIKNIEGPEGVRGRNSDNTLIESLLGWKPTYSLRDGMKITFAWIKKQYEA